jgi:myo-inositol-1(or 4)-monophosphatase
VSPWLDLCRAAVADVKDVLAAMPGYAERARPIRQGEGGDVTAALDEAAEAATLKHFDRNDVRIVSEEIGHRGEGRYTVLVDPIDGSQNAERGIPYFCLSVAVAEGDTIDDVFFGYVYDFGANEEWTAVKGGGAFLQGEPIVGAPKDHVEFLSIEATRAALVHDRLRVLGPLTDRVRVMGAQALTFCHLAAGRTDAVTVLRPSRAVDYAAGQLVVRERGLAIELPDDPPIGRAPLDLIGRSRVVAAANDELVRKLSAALLTP